MISSLIWKEWHEQRWKLVFGCILFMSFTAIGLRARLVTDETISFAVIVMAALVLPVIVSMGLVAPERADGSFQTLLALPVERWKILAVKTAMGVAGCIAPLLAAAVVTCVIAGGRELSVWQILAMYARGMGTVLALFLWMLALGIGLPTEARAGLVGLGILVIWLIGSMGMSMNQAGWLWPFSPLGFLPMPEAREMVSRPLAALSAHALIVPGLWALAAWRLAREEGSPQ